MMDRSGHIDEKGRNSPVLRAVLLWFFAFAVRAIFLIEVRDQPVFSFLMVDSRAYDLWARGIADGNILGNSVFYQAPLYPYFLGGLYSVFGAEPSIVFWVQAAIGATSCVLLERAGRIFIGPVAGLLAGLLLAVHPTAIFSDGLIQKTSLDVFFMTSLLALLADSLGSGKKIWSWFGIGVVLGCLALTRENSIVLLPVVLLWGWFGNPEAGLRERSKRVAILVAGLALVLLPVGFRNMVVGGEFHLTTSQAGPNFFIGNNPDATGVYRPLVPGRGDVSFERRDATEIAERDVRRRLTPGEVSRYWLDRSWAFVSDAPGRWFSIISWKSLLFVNKVEIADTYDQYSYSRWSSLMRVLNPVVHLGVLLPLAVVGFLWSRSKWRTTWILPAMAIVYAASVVLFFVSSRYRFPVVPILLPFSAAGIVGIASIFRSRDFRSLPLYVVIAIAVAVPANWSIAADQVLKAEVVMLDNIGVGLMVERGRPEEAIGYFQEAIRLGPGFPNSYYNQGLALTKLGRTREAVFFFDKAVGIQPGSPEMRYEYGRALSAVGMRVDAVRQYQFVTMLDPNHAWAHYQASIDLQALERSGEAAYHFRAAKRLNPAFPGN